MFFLYAIPVVIVYLMVAAFLSNKFERRFAALCKNCTAGEPYTQNIYNDMGRHIRSIEREPGDGHGPDGLWAGMFWPVTLPFFTVYDAGNPRVKRGKAAIDRYWQEKDDREVQARYAQLEKELL